MKVGAESFGEWGRVSWPQCLGKRDREEGWSQQTGALLPAVPTGSVTWDRSHPVPLIWNGSHWGRGGEAFFSLSFRCSGEGCYQACRQRHGAARVGHDAQ